MDLYYDDQFFINEVNIKDLYKLSLHLGLNNEPSGVLISTISEIVQDTYRDPNWSVDNFIELINQKLEIKNEDEEKNFSILILCADNKAYIKKSWLSILRKLFPTILEKNCNIYYLGTNLREHKPFRINGTIDRNMDSFDQFDLIFSERCPLSTFSEKTQEIIYNHLNFKGVFITPNFDFQIRESFFVLDLQFTHNYDKYNLYSKKNQRVLI